MKFNIAKWSIGVLTVCTLSACAQFGKQAPLEEPTAYSLSEGKSAVMAKDAWWLQLHDKKLNLLIAQAIQTYPDLRVAKARFDQAQAQLGLTEAATKTQIGFSVRGAGAYVSPKPTSRQGETDNTLLLANAALQGSWEFDFWGKNRNQIASVLGKRQAILYEARQTRIMLANAVAAQYFAWQSLEEQQKLLARRTETADRTLQLMQRRVRAKLMPPESLYQIELLQHRLQLERLSLEQQTAKVRNSLSALTGNAPYTLPVRFPEEMANVPNLPVDRIYADLLAARPDIAVQKSLLESKYHAIKSTEAEFYPNIELKVLAGMAHIDAFNVIHGRNSAMLGILPALNLPIFTSGALQSKLWGRRAEYNEQVAIYDRTVLNAMRSAADAVVDYQSLQAKKLVWDKMLNTSGKSVRAVQNRVKVGLENGLGVLQKQEERFQLQMQAVQYQAEYLTAWSNLHAQLGGGVK